MDTPVEAAVRSSLPIPDEASRQSSQVDIEIQHESPKEQTKVEQWEQPPKDVDV